MKRVIVECNPDELLVRVLGLGIKEIAHQSNKGEVCNYLRKTDINIAILDEDPSSGQPNYLKEFNTVDEKFGVRKLQHKAVNKTILVIRPRLEEWIISQCRISGINPVDFFLPQDAKRLKDEINIRLKHFANLLAELLRKENPGLKYIQSFF